MGAIKTDNNGNERALESRYMALDNADGVKRLLRDYHALVERQYDGDYDAVILLVDLATAIEKAGLTERQREALTLVFFEDLMQVEAGKAMGVRQDTVSKLVKSALAKIAAVYEAWSWRGEGYSLTKRHEVANEWEEVKAVVPLKHGKWRTVR